MLLVVLLVTQVSAQAVSVSIEQLDAIMAKLGLLDSIRKAIPELSISSLVITEDQSGRIFVPGKLVGVLKLGPFGYDFEIPLNTTVVRMEPRKVTEPVIAWRFRLLGSLSTRFSSFSSTEMSDLAIDLQPVRFSWLAVNSSIGLSRIGASLSFPVTNAIDAHAGLSVRYSSGNPELMLGISLPLN